MHPDVAALLAIVRRGDAVEIEAARDLVRPELLPELLAAYWRLSTWDERAGLMQLFMDYPTVGGDAVMRHFLTAPTTELNDEYFTSGKIAALCQLAGTFAFYERLWYDRALCSAVIARVLAGEAPSSVLVETPSPALVDELDRGRGSTAAGPRTALASRSQGRRGGNALDRLLAPLSQKQRNALSVVFLVVYAAVGAALLAFILANPVRVLAVAAVLGVGLGGYLLYGAWAPDLTRGQPPALRWLLVACGLVALGMGGWSASTLLGEDLGAAWRPGRPRLAIPAVDWPSVAVIAMGLGLPLALTWAVGRWWARRERAWRRDAQQEGEVFAIAPLIRSGLLFGAFGMVAFAAFAAIAGLNGARTGFRLADSLVVAGLFGAIGVGLLLWARQTSGLVVLNDVGVALRRLGGRWRFVSYEEIAAVRPMAFGVPPVMVVAGRRALRIPRTVDDLPRLYGLLMQRAPALRRQGQARVQRYAVPTWGPVRAMVEGWFTPPDVLTALELSPLQLRYRRGEGDWTERWAEEITGITTVQVDPRRAVSTDPQVNLPTHDVVVSFRKGAPLRISQQDAARLGTTPEALYVALVERYGGG